MSAAAKLASAWGPLRQAGKAAWRGLTRSPRPLVGIEVDSEGLGVVKFHRGRGDVLSLETVVDQPLAPGVVVPSLTEGGVAEAEAFREPLRQALERAGALGERRVALILPDVVARVTVIATQELSASRGLPTDDVLRFRLKDRVPFDIREARLGCVPANGQRGRDVPDWIVAAGLREVFDSYEAPCAELGLEVGRVELTGLALLRTAIRTRPTGDWILIQWGHEYASLFLWRDGHLVLARTLSGRAGSTDVAREVASTVLYHRERLEGTLSGALVRVVGRPLADAQALLEGPLGLFPEPVPAPVGAGEGGEPMMRAAGAIASLMSEES